MNRLFTSIAVASLLLSSTASAQPPKVWVSILLVYAAPDNAVNWHGPWTRGMTFAGKNFYPTEAECKNDTDGWIGRLHEGMKAPVLYRCVPFQESLP